MKGLAKGTHYGSSGELPFIAGIDGVADWRMARASTSALREALSAPFASARWRRVGCACRCRKQSTMLPRQELQIRRCPPGCAYGASEICCRRERSDPGSDRRAGQIADSGCQASWSATGHRRRAEIPQALERFEALGADSSSHSIRIRRLRSPPFAAKLQRRESMSCSITCGVSPPELVLQAISQKGLRKAGARVRFIQIGESAGKDDLAGGGHSTQFGARTSGQRLWQRKSRPNP